MNSPYPPAPSPKYWERGRRIRLIGENTIHKLLQPSLITFIIGLTLPACFGPTTGQSVPPPVEPHIQVVAEGLLRPIGLARLPDGSLLVAEAGSGADDDSGGVSLIKPDGRIGRLISGLPSSRDAGDIAGVNLVGVSPEGDTVYVGNFGAGHLWTLPLTADQQQAGLEIPETPFRPEDLMATMQPLNRVRLVNPFDITFDQSDAPVVSDASENGIAKANPDGTTRFIHRFPDLPAQSIEAVPTGLTRVGKEYYVTLTGGCPYPAQSGMLVAVDEARHQRPVIEGLNMPIDVAQAAGGALWLLEFATFDPEASCFTGQGYRPHTGRLSRLRPDGALETVMDGLNYPGAVLPAPDGSLYMTRVFDGQVVTVRFAE